MLESEELSLSDMALGSSLNVVEDLFGKEDCFVKEGVIHPKRESCFSISCQQLDSGEWGLKLRDGS